ncbi:hypothetical protein SEA_IHOP_63 [Mycobacterium phage IHOP]|uniref:DUF7372 domain-containing protein n=2 Tax=Kostyavirus toto TaxID=1993871 RepID=A0A345KX56_9CAUD|nr:hypothetical protein SEA_IHOP_63 [Mycobacterium phage IHOP]AXH48241.1 hypothetical protein SEA_PHAJA_63 [Mycobacterium phage Phaja]
MHYKLKYDRKEVKYMITAPGVHEEFTMWTAHRVWDWIQNHLTPGDTLHFVPET